MTIAKDSSLNSCIDQWCTPYILLLMDVNFCLMFMNNQMMSLLDLYLYGLKIELVFVWYQ